MNLLIALRPHIEIGYAFLDFVKGVAGAFVDLPNAQINITQLSATNVNAHCETKASTPPDEVAFNNLYQNLTHIASSVGIVAGLDLHLKVNMPLLPDLKFNWPMTLPMMDVPMPTAYLVFQKDNTSGEAFAPAQEIIASVSRQNKKNAAGGLVNPLASESGLWAVCLWKIFMVGLGL
ncbi:hypothetical protein B0O99DRAFT_689223 [Bisporella sp. PMI_857]|nr:hypothetical protein B0O99DRAFT_689223 [Bisporella sp. PMI_857]